jgi:glycosyltransferase 2 family protein
MEPSVRLERAKWAEWFKHYVWSPSKWVFTPVAIAFVLYFAWQARADMLQLWRTSNKSLLTLAFVPLVLVNILSPCASRAILRSLGTSVEYRTLLSIHLCRLPARYLPGGVWHTFGRAIDLREHGVSRRTVSWMIFVENVLAILVAFVLGGMLLLVAQLEHTKLFFAVATITMIAIAAIAIFPIFLVRKLVIQRTSQWAECSLWFAVIWLTYASSFVLYSMALVDTVSVRDSVHTAGAYLFSWAVGLIAFFAPQGVGVFEVSAATLSPRGLAPATVVVAAGFRVCMLITDLLLGAMGYLFRRRPLRD